MAKPNKRQAKEDLKIKCEYSGCVATFGRNSERRRHVKEKHGPLIYCCVPGCKWTTRRMGRFKIHLDNAHGSEASTNHTLPSEFRTATAQSLASSSKHFSAPDANINSKFAPNPSLIYSDYAFTPQVHQSQPDASESFAALNGKEAPRPEYNPTSRSLVPLRTRVHVAPCRVFRPCRVRRRTSRTTARTSSTGPPVTRRGSAIEPTLRFYSNEQDNSTPFTQWMPDPFNVELMASFLCSLSLDYSIN